MTSWDVSPVAALLKTVFSEIDALWLFLFGEKDHRISYPNLFFREQFCHEKNKTSHNEACAQSRPQPYRVLLCVCGQTLRLFRTFPQLCHNAFLMFPCPLFKCELSLFSRSVKTTPWAAQTLFTKADEICVIASHVLLHLLFSSNNYESTRKKWCHRPPGFKHRANGNLILGMLQKPSAIKIPPKWRLCCT